MARNVAVEPLLPVDEIQGDVLVGLLKRVERLVFFEVTDRNRFRQFVSTVRLTSARDCLNQRDLVAARKAQGLEIVMPTPGLNLALTPSGLEQLGVRAAQAGLDAFNGGMAARAAILGDPPQREWKILKSKRRPAWRVHPDGRVRRRNRRHDLA